MTDRITTHYINPPIPVRTCDWCAYIEGTEEDGLYGYGRTEQEAIEDLMELIGDDNG